MKKVNSNLRLLMKFDLTSLKEVQHNKRIKGLEGQGRETGGHKWKEGEGEAPLRFEPCTYSVKATCYTTQPAHHLYDFWAEVV